MRKLIAPALLMAALLAAGPAGRAQTMQPYGWPIDLTQAKWVAQAAEDKSNAMGLAMVIAVVEPTGDLVYFERMPGASYGSIKVAEAKARAAALYRFSTKQMQDIAKGGVDFGSFPDGMPLEGGVPIIVQGRVIGAVGVSGGLPDQDEQVAEAAAAAAH